MLQSFRLYLRGMTLERIALVFGFGLSIASTIGSQLYLAPVVDQVQATTRALDDTWARLKIIRGANALFGLLQSFDGLVYLVPANFTENPNGANTVAEITTRAIHARHDAVRNYFAQAASASEVDYDDVMRRYDELVAAETANWSMETYRATNALPADLNMKVAADRWQLEKSVLLQKANFFQSSFIKEHRAWMLSLLDVISSTLLFGLALAAARERPVPPRLSTDTLNKATNLMSLALIEAHRRIDEAKGSR